jgi:hypothetical protein
METTPTARPPAARSLQATLASLARRRAPRQASRDQAVRQAEIRRLALALREGGRALKANRTQLQAIVDDVAPGLTDRPGIGPVSAAQVIVSFSHPGRCRNDAAFAALAGTSPLQASAAAPSDTASTAVVTEPSTARSTPLPSPGCAAAPPPALTSHDAPQKARPPARSGAAWKRYIARQLYRTLTTAMTPTAHA